MTTKDEQLIFKFFECKKNYKKDFNKELFKRFANICEFCHEYINKFILLLRKGVYPYEYMDSWKRFAERHCLIKKLFIATYIWKILQVFIIGMQKECLKALIIKI